MPAHSTKFLALVVLALVVLLSIAEFGPAVLSGKGLDSAYQSVAPKSAK